MASSINPKGESSDSPIFKDVFKHHWNNLPPVFKKHYLIKGYSANSITASGKMNITYPLWISLFAPLLNLLGIGVFKRADDIPVTVHFKGSISDNFFHIQRIFHLEGRNQLFESYMQHDGNRLIEFYNFGIGWRLKYHVTNEKICLKHHSYVFKIDRLVLPLPIQWLVGKIHAEEVAISNNEFTMFAELRHPLFGLLYRYQGHFEI